MRIFESLKKQNKMTFSDTDIISPVGGKMISPLEISDITFRDQLIGQTVGFIPKQDVISCPVNGVINFVFPTLHAFGIRANTGVNYLVHIGINTVSMKGQGFKTFIKKGDIVRAGQKAIQVNWGAVKKAGCEDTVVLIVTEKPRDYPEINYIPYGKVESLQRINVS